MKHSNSRIALIVLSVLAAGVAGAVVWYAQQEVSMPSPMQPQALENEAVSEQECGEKPQLRDFWDVSPEEATRADPPETVLNAYNEAFKTWEECVEMLSWQIYRNEEFGFEFKYPEEWSVESVGEPYEYAGYVIEDFFKLQRIEDDSGAVRIITFSNAEGDVDTVAQALAERMDESLEGKTENLSQRTFSGRTAWEVSGITIGATNRILFMQVSAKTVLLINTYANDVAAPQLDKEVNQILSTFRFVDPGLGSDSVGVKTLYVDSKLVDCVGVEARKCLRVRETPEQAWELFYDEIHGFTFEPGYVYTLRVSVEAVDNPPADASSLRYELIEVIDKDNR